MRIRILFVLAMTMAMGQTACSDETVPIAPDKHKPHHQDDDDKPNPDPSGGGGAQGSESGSRLKARSYHGADGSKQFLGWYDSARDEECAFGMAADGVVRCLPTATTPSGKNNYTRYFDSKCLYPIVDYACDGLKYISTDTTSSCKAGTKSIFPLIEQKVAAGAPLYQGSPSSCFKDDYPAYGNERIGGNELAPTEFVSAEIQTD